MATLNYDSIYNWIAQRGPDCTPAQLDRLAELLAQVTDLAAQRESRSRSALDAANRAARDAGYASIEDLLSRVGSKPRKPARHANAGAAAPRRPHMDPLDANSDAYALTKYKVLPEWAQARLAEGFTMQDLHYKKHAAAMRRVLGCEPVYDAVTRHNELLTR
jgi:hypothetical protein